MSKHSYQHFLEYAPFIGQVLAAWPGPVTVGSTSLTGNTLAEYLRRALKAKKLHGWRSDRVDEGLWALYGDKILCQITDDGEVRLGSREILLRKQPADVKLKAQQDFEIALMDNTPDVLVQICELQGRRIMEPAPIFLVSITDEQATSLQKLYPDVVIERVTSGQHRIL